jgi:hypothetical protein
MWVAAGVVLWHPKSWPDVWVFSLAPVVFLAAVVAFILDRHLMKMRANILAAVEQRSRTAVVESVPTVPETAASAPAADPSDLPVEKGPENRASE